jgi:hypothetical protein
MTNLLRRAINCDDADRAATIILGALGIESDNVVQLLLPKDFADRPRAPRSHHRRVAQNRGALPRLVTEPGRFPHARGRRAAISELY